MKIPSIMEMLESGVHFGHQVSRWHPKMAEYIFGERNGVHVINLEETRKKMEETLGVVKNMAAEGKQILFITTKPQAREIVKAAAIDCGMPYLVERWIGGLLTNFDEMKRLFRKYISLKEQQANGELERYTKHERAKIQKELEKMEINLVGLAHMEKIPDALFVPAFQREKTAVVEAQRMHVPMIAVCDTNADPKKADYIIPANDDAVNAIKMVVGLVAEAVKEGRAEFEKKQKSEVASRKVEDKGSKKDEKEVDWN